MKPAAFDYYRPNSMEEAISVLAEMPSAKMLAGGQSLIPAMNFRLSTPSLLIDIGRLPELREIEATSEGITIGAGVTQARVEHSTEVADVAPGLLAALKWVGHQQIRTRSTVCGSLAHADPAAELPSFAVNASAEITVRSVSGSRVVAASDFFLGPFWTALDDTEIITHVHFPAQLPDTITVVDEIARRAGHFAIVGAVGNMTTDDGAITSATLTGFGVGGMPVRLQSTETALSILNMNSDKTQGDLLDAVFADTDPLEDIHATAEYRREALAGLVLRMMRSVLSGRQGGRR